MYRKLLEHKKNKLTGPLDLTDSEKQLLSELKAQNQDDQKVNLYSWKYSLDLASFGEEVVSIHHLHLKEFVKFNDRNNHLFLAHIRSEQGCQLKLIDLANVVHDTLTLPEGQNLEKIKIADFGRPEIFLYYKDKIESVKITNKPNSLARTKSEEINGPESLQFKFYSPRKSAFGERNLLLHANMT